MVEVVEGSTIGFVGEAMVEVDVGAVFFVGDTEVEIENVFVDRVFKEPLVVVVIR